MEMNNLAKKYQPFYHLVWCPRHNQLTSHMGEDCTLEPCWEQVAQKIREELSLHGELRHER